MFNPILQKFSEKSPVSVIVQALVEHLLNAEKMDAWFETKRDVQYTKKILFSSLIGIMLQVVCRLKDNVHTAYLDSNIEVSRQALYDKLKNVELGTSQELVHYIGSETEIIIREMNATQPPLVNGYRTKFLDSHCIEATEKIIKELKNTNAGTLPAKSLVVFEQELGIVSDVFPCKDRDAQERSLLSAVLDTVKKDEIWCADSNFCVLNFLFKIHHKEAYFVIRQHDKTPFNHLSKKAFIGKSKSGKVYEQRISLNFEGKVKWTPPSRLK